MSEKLAQKVPVRPVGDFSSISSAGVLRNFNFTIPPHKPFMITRHVTRVGVSIPLAVLERALVLSRLASSDSGCRYHNSRGLIEFPDNYSGKVWGIVLCVNLGCICSFTLLLHSCYYYN